jgi:N-acyl-D-amino-acid deacylase
LYQLFELLVENGGSVPTVFFHHSELDMRHVLAQPFVSIRTDGSAVSVDGTVGPVHPHPRFYGTFPRVLGRYVREARLLSVEEAVRKMTSANAAKVHLFERGLLRRGLWADVTIFDAARQPRTLPSTQHEPWKRTTTRTDSPSASRSRQRSSWSG